MHTGGHAPADMDKDKRIVIQQLLDANVFSHIGNREHTSFKKLILKKIQ